MALLSKLMILLRKIISSVGGAARFRTLGLGPTTTYKHTQTHTHTNTHTNTHKRTHTNTHTDMWFIINTAIQH